MIGLENPLHIALILAVLLLVFGAKRLPEMGKGIGEGMRGFKQAISGEETHQQPIGLSPVQEQPAARSAAAAAAAAEREKTPAA